MKRLITLLNGSGRRSVMTLLLLYAVLSNGLAANYIFVWEEGQPEPTEGTSLGNDDEVTIPNLKANTTYCFWLRAGSETGDKYGFSEDKTETIGNLVLTNNNPVVGKFKTTIAGSYKFDPNWNNGLTLSVQPIYKDCIRYAQANRSDLEYVPITYSGDVGTAKIDLTAGQYKFAISNGDAEWYGCSSTVSSTSMDLEFSKGTNDCGIAANTNGTYYFSIKWDNGVPKVSVGFPVADYYINSNGTRVKGVYGLYDSGAEIHFTLPASCYNEGNISFYITKRTEGIITYLTANSPTFTAHSQKNKEGSTVEGITDNAGSATNFTYTNTTNPKTDDPDDVITVIYHMADGSLVLDYESRQDIMDYSFYLIVPNKNVGNTNRAIPDWEGIAPEGHKAFRLYTGRERNKDVLNKEFVTLNLKIDGKQLRYDDKEEIKFYILSGIREGGRPCFQPIGNDNERYLKKAPDSGDDEKAGYYGVASTNQIDGYGVRSHATTTYSEGNNNYYIIHKNDAGNTKSLTFMFSEQNGEREYLYDRGAPTKKFGKGNTVNSYNPGGPVGGNNGNLIVGFLQSRGAGSDYYTAHIKNGVYLVGKIASSDYTSNDRYPMTKRLWKNGAIVTGIDETQADSIVYECDVRNESKSWDEFYLSFTTGDMFGKPDNNGVKTASNHWSRLLRPHVQDQMDANALEGGVFFFCEGGDQQNYQNMQQSLNPLLTEVQKQRYASYTVYFNATYSTYRIEFHDGFYIAGPAVNGISSDANDGEYFGKGHRKTMVSRNVNGVQCYVYEGDFKKGSTFAFFVNEETFANNYSEDDDDSHVNNNTGDMWTTQAPTGEDKGKDYPFYNHVKWNTTGDNDNQSLGVANNAILWTLPDGRYTLRFYNHVEESDNNQLYTIDKVVTLKNATSTFAETEGGEEKTHNYGSWRTFSDDCALWLPTGIKAYYVSEINDNKQAVLKEVENNTIPAHCGVLLYDENLLEGTEEVHLYPVPTGYTTTLKAGETNLLVDCYDKDNTIQPEDEGKYNYFLTCFCYKGGKKVGAAMNFWKARVSDSNAKKNYTYLQVDKDINPVAYNSITGNYEFETNPVAVASNARNYCFLLSFGDFDDSVITGITSVGSGKEANASEAWYTIQGVRIGKPVVPGIYISNGKKVIIK